MTVFWQDSFETGDFSAWDTTSEGARNAVVTDGSANGGPSAGRKGTHFYQSEVDSGDLFASGERCEIDQGEIQAVNGNDRWYGWSSFWPAGLPLSLGTSVRSIIVGQFHSNADAVAFPNMNQANLWILAAPNQAGVNFGYTTSSPGIIFGINGGDPPFGGQRLNFNTQTGGANSDPFTSYAFDLGPATTYLGVGWVDWIVHVVWHDAGQGLVELYRRLPGETNYTMVAQLLDCSTMYKGYSAYFKLGQYRTPHPSSLSPGFTWYDAVAFGTSFADVDPVAVAASRLVGVSRTGGGGHRVVNPAGRMPGMGGGGI